MRKAWYQKLVSSYIPWIFVGFLFLGSILDTFNNAVNLISTRISVLGTVSILLAALLTQIYLKRRPVRWVTKDGQQVYIKSLGWGSIFALTGIFFALWIPHLVRPFGSAGIPTSGITGIDTNTNSRREDEPLAIQPLWGYEKPPGPRMTNHDGDDFADGIKFIVAMRIVNRTARVILIDNFRFTWQILDPTSAFEEFGKTDLRLRMFADPDSGKPVTLQEALASVSGGYIDGSADAPFFKYPNENEMLEATGSNFMPKSASNHVWPPLKLEGYEEVFVHLPVELDILRKDGKRFALSLEGQNEAAEFYKLVPLFFGAKNVNDLVRKGQLIIQSSDGELIYEMSGPIAFAGATLYLPRELLNHKRK